mgnify:CR=1 FL=1|jgi:hypothetical protein
MRTATTVVVKREKRTNFTCDRWWAVCVNSSVCCLPCVSVGVEFSDRRDHISDDDDGIFQARLDSFFFFERV